MAKFDDVQIDKFLFHGQTASQEIHSPSGKTPAHGADAPIVTSNVVAFSAGKQITPTGTINVGVGGLRFANPA